MFRPTLAVNADMAKVQYPVYASPKLDGIRCSIVNGKALSRTLKSIPNKEVYEFLSKMDYDGLDGELIVGPPTAEDCYTKTVSKIMSHDKGLDKVTYHVFDKHNAPGRFIERLDTLVKFAAPFAKGTLKIEVLPQALISNEDDLLEYEAEKVNEGFEGVILRAPEAPYKFGRSTVNEGYLLKCKRFSDSEAEIIGFEEEMFNGNCAETNELGRTKRSTAKAGLSGKSTLGAFKVRDIHTGVEFAIGTGLTALQRGMFWQRQDEYLGKLCKYKFFPVGVKIAPRHPVFLGLRDRRDL
jgi:DNA ligase-1